MFVPFIDLKAQYHSIKPEVGLAINNVLENTAFILGDEVKKFEEEFAEYCQTKYAVAVNSGTSALHLALLAAGIKAGDEVITVPNTFIATIEAILYVGAKPVFVDVDSETYTMNTDALEAKITSRTKAILPVHLYGQPAKMNIISDIARKYGLIVIEDACQAHGAEFAGRRVGSLGHFGCFSFYPGKNLGAYGDGGMVVTNDTKHWEQMRVLRDHGSVQKYHHTQVGYNYRLAGIQGAILRVKMKYIEQWTEARRKNAALYNQLLDEVDVVTPFENPDARHVYHLYIVRVKNRSQLQNYLNDKNIVTGLHYPVPVHLNEGYAFLGNKKGDFPITEKYANEILSLPMYAELSEAQIKYVVTAIREFQSK